MSAIEAGSGTVVICALTEVRFGVELLSVGAWMAILPAIPMPWSVTSEYVVPPIALTNVVGVQTSELLLGSNAREPVMVPTKLVEPLVGFVWEMLSVKVTPAGIAAVVPDEHPMHSVPKLPRSTTVGAVYENELAP